MMSFERELDERFAHHDIAVPAADPKTNEVYKDFIEDLKDDLQPELSKVEQINELSFK